MSGLKRKKIAIYAFGGTIGMVPDAHGVLTPAKSASDILRAVPSIAEMADIHYEQIENRDSTNINPGYWTSLIFKIREVHDQFDGIIVTHGTDTMAYHAGAVSLGLGRGLKIPIVFTGAQLPLIAFGSDARFNLENSIKTVIEASAQGIAEVMIVFSDRVLRANRSIKTSESKFLAFDSPAFPPLGMITALGIDFIPDARVRQNNVPLEIKPHFQRGILTVDLVPGLEPGILLQIIRSGHCQGLLLKSLGAGNVPSMDEYSLIPVIAEATRDCNVPVLVSTKFIGGNTHMDVYQPGKAAREAGAIPTGDMTDVMAQVKLMWALAQGFRKPDELCRVLLSSYAGEVSGEEAA